MGKAVFFAGVALVGGCILLVRGLRDAPVQRPDGTHGLRAVTPALESVRTPIEPATEVPDSSERTELGDAVADGAPDDLRVIEAQPESFRSAMRAVEGSVFGRLDVNSLLDAALVAAEGELDPRVIVDPDGSGALRFPLSVSVEGVAAEFRILNGTPEYPVIIGIGLSFDAPREPYLLDAAIRQGAELFVTVWTNEGGEVGHFTAMTKSLVAHRATSDDLGVPWDKGTITEGLLCHYSATQGDNIGLKEHGLVDGNPKTWKSAGSLEAPPDMEKVRRFSDRCLSLYRSVDR